MATWKAHERVTAKALGGRRISRGDDFSRSDGDIDHPMFAVECKQRKALAIYGWWKQAAKYAERSGKIPIVVAHEHGAKKRLVIIEMEDFLSLLKGEGDAPAREG